MDLNSALVAHVRWKVRLLTSVETGEVPDRQTSCVDNRCDLGKWIHGEAERCIKDPGLFQRLRSSHAEFHSGLGPIIDALASRHLDEAQRQIHGPEFQARTEAVVECLVLLKHQDDQGAKS